MVITSLVNGEWLCVRCNAKELSAASVERSEGTDGSTHRVVWTGHSGVRRTTTPTPLLWETAPRPRNTPTEEGSAEESLLEEDLPEEDSAAATSAAERSTEEHLAEETASGETAAPERPLAEELSADDPEDAGPTGEVTGDDEAPGPPRYRSGSVAASDSAASAAASSTPASCTQRASSHRRTRAGSSPVSAAMRSAKGPGRERRRSGSLNMCCSTS